MARTQYGSLRIQFANLSQHLSPLTDVTWQSEALFGISGCNACTAVPIELVGEASAEFHAEVHLKTGEQWAVEVKQYLHDLLMKDCLASA